jgi:hypothetical protein
MTPLPNQNTFWHGLSDLPNQQDLFDCDLATRPPLVGVNETKTPDRARAAPGNGDEEDRIGLPHSL